MQTGMCSSVSHPWSCQPMLQECRNRNRILKQEMIKINVILKRPIIFGVIPLKIRYNLYLMEIETRTIAPIYQLIPEKEILQTDCERKATVFFYILENAFVTVWRFFVIFYNVGLLCVRNYVFLMHIRPIFWVEHLWVT